MHALLLSLPAAAQPVLTSQSCFARYKRIDLACSFPLSCWVGLGTQGTMEWPSGKEYRGEWNAGKRDGEVGWVGSGGQSHGIQARNYLVVGGAVWLCGWWSTVEETILILLQELVLWLLLLLVLWAMAVV